MVSVVDQAIQGHARGHMTLQHNRLKDKKLSACCTANLSPICEQKNLIPETNSQPRDVYLPCWSAEQPAALDKTIKSSVLNPLKKKSIIKNDFFVLIFTFLTKASVKNFFNCFF